MNMYEMVLEHWESNAPGFNHGQLSIYLHHMEPVIYEWLDGAQSDWPYADADYYMDSLFSSYNGEVTFRAFSDVISSPVDQMWEMIYQAQELYETAQMFEAMSIF